MGSGVVVGCCVVVGSNVVDSGVVDVVGSGVLLDVVDSSVVGSGVVAIKAVLLVVVGGHPFCSAAEDSDETHACFM